MKLRTIGIAVVAAVALGGTALAVARWGLPFGDDPPADAAPGDAEGETADADSGDQLDTVGIERGDLTATTEFTGSLDFGDAWPLALTADGIVTGARPVGSVVGFGESLIETDNHERAFLVEGDVPMYRDLELTSPNLKGGDVQQLQRFLIALGFDRDGTLQADGVFGNSTRRAVRDWQQATFQPDTGRVTRAQMVFHPTPLRIAGEQRIGSVFEALEVTGWEPAVTVEVANRDRQLLAVGTGVTIEFGDGSTVTGTVSEQVSVPQDDGSTMARSTIDPAGDVPGETGRVTIGVETTLASDVTIAPVGALLALAEGGYAVEVVDGVDRRLVGVEVGEILDGRAEVSGAVEVGDIVLVAK